jgi:hypothetical protein
MVDVCSDPLAPDIAVVIVVVVILTWFGWCHTSLDGGTSYADPITILRDLAPPLSHVGRGATMRLPPCVWCTARPLLR